MNNKQMMDCAEFAVYLLRRNVAEECFFTIETDEGDVWYGATRLCLMHTHIIMLGCPGGGEFSLFDLSVPAPKQILDELEAFLEQYLKERAKDGITRFGVEKD